METKPCTLCKIVKPLSDFMPRMGYKNNIDSRCRACHNKEAIKWRKTHKEKFAVIQARYHQTPKGIAKRKQWRNRVAAKTGAPFQQEYMREWRKRRVEYRRNYELKHDLWSKYRLTVEGFHAMLAAQNSSCAIFLKPQSPKKRLAVDHCHKRKTNRGLLCSDCNLMFGENTDSVEILQRAIEYIRKYQI